MSIIDELVVKLRLDLGRFRSDANTAESTLNNVSDASHRTARNMESDGNVMASGFGKVRNQMLAVLGLFTAGMGLKNFTQSTIKQADSFGFMSDSIGMTTTRLRAYSDATERAGGSGDAMTDALKKSASDVANLKMGMKTLGEIDQGNLLTRWSGAAGLDPSKIFESGESLLQARLKVFETIRKTDKDNPLLHGVDPAVLAATVLEQGGIGAGVTNALKNKGGLDGFNKSITNQEKINSVLAGSEDLARKARESWFDLTQQFTIIGQKIVVTLTPAFIKLTEYLKKIKLPSPEVVGKTIDVWIAKFSQLWDKTQKTVDYVSEKWNTFSEVVKKVTNNGVDLTDGFTVVAGVLAGLVAINVLGWVTGIVGVLGSLVIAAGSAAAALAPLAAVAAAGAGGAYVGNKMYNKLDIKSQDFLGSMATKTAAFFGDKDAKQALATNEAYSGDVSTKGTKGGSVADMLRGGESGKEGYDAYNRGTGLGSTGHQDISSLTLGEIKRRQALDKKDKDRLMAVGMYQMIPATLRGGQEHLGLSDDTVFSPEIQEQLFSKYLAGAKRKKIESYIKGDSNDAQAMGISAAAEWRSIADPRTGKTYADKGSVGNAASISAEKWLESTNKARDAYQENLKRGMTEDEAYQKALHGLVGKNAENISVATPEQKKENPPPIIIPKGEKDINGKVEKSPLIIVQEAARVQPQASPEPDKKELPLAPIIAEQSPLGKKDKQGENEYIEVEDPMFPSNPKVKEKNPKFIAEEPKQEKINTKQPMDALPVVSPQIPKIEPLQIPKFDMPVVSDLYSSMPQIPTTAPQHTNNQSVHIGSQVFNIKANDTEGVKKEVSSKMIINESLTQNFNSGMR